MNPWIVRYVVPEQVPLLGGQDLSVPSYYFFLMIGFILASETVVREARRAKEDVGLMLDLALLVLVAGLVGARLGHIFFEAPAYYWEHPTYIFQFWRGGMVYYGGLLLAIGVSIDFCRRKKLSFWRVADIYAPAICFGLIFGRMGCLSGGCCFGKPADFPFGLEVPWAITFYRGQVPKELYGVDLHPTQIYEALFCAGLYLFLIYLRKRQKFDGQIFWIFLSSYSVFRSINEVFRFDEDRGTYLGGWLTTSQIISAVLLTGALISLPALAKKARANGSYGLGPAWPSLPRNASSAEAGSP